MQVRPGRVAELFRYPVKSMAGTSMEAATLGWYGLPGDRRFAFRRMAHAGGFPWLTASKLPELILYRPEGIDEADGERLPTHVLTPAGDRFELRGEHLRREIRERFGGEVELMQLRQGIFDDSPISVIASTTIARVCGEAGVESDSRRFRPNVVIECDGADPFAEDGWVGSTLLIGDEGSGPAIHLTKHDERCMMINLDPESAKQDPRVLKAAVRLNGGNAGVYGTVVRVGQIEVGDPVMVVPGLAVRG